MRCGSTWSHSILSQHPEIQTSEPKQLNYFNRRILNEDLRWYASFFDPPAGSKPASIRGEVTPFYARLKRPSIECIHTFMPKVKILLTVRNPIDRVWSQALYDFGVYHHRDVSLVPPWRYLMHFERQRTMRYSDYSTMIDTWMAVFGKEALHVSLFDDIRSDPDRYLDGVLTHIGADSSWRPPGEVLRRRVLAEGDKRQRREIPDVLRWYLACQWLEPVKRLNAQLGGRVSHWVVEIKRLTETYRMTWPLVRLVNRYGCALPESVAFAGYDRWTDIRLARRWKSLLSEWKGEG